MKLCHSLWTSPKFGLQYQKYILYLIEILWAIFDLPFFQSEEYFKIFSKSSRYRELELKTPVTSA